jgi:hypothetical protein
VRSNPAEVFKNRPMAPGTTAPFSSVTVPLKDAVTDCASTAAYDAKNKNSKGMRSFIIDMGFDIFSFLRISI